MQMMQGLTSWTAVEPTCAGRQRAFYNLIASAPTPWLQARSISPAWPFTFSDMQALQNVLMSFVNAHVVHWA